MRIALGFGYNTFTREAVLTEQPGDKRYIPRQYVSSIYSKSLLKIL